MEYVTSIILIVVLVIFAIIEIRKPSVNEEERIANTKRVITNLVPIVLILITNAEYLYGGKTGPFKKSYVIDELYKRIPDEYKKYITQGNLIVLIEEVLPTAEELWTDNPQLVNRN